MPVGRTNRRAFIAALGRAAAWPLGVRAEKHDRVRRVGFLMRRAHTSSMNGSRPSRRSSVNRKQTEAATRDQVGRRHPGDHRALLSPHPRRVRSNWIGISESGHYSCYANRGLRPMFAATAAVQRRFQLVLIKPSHYDDDGYVIQWVRAIIPSNTLAVLYSLGRDAAQRAVLGADTAIDICVIDEINQRVRIDQLLSQFRRHGGFGLLAIVGVQSNQFPRALDIARPFRAAGVPAMIGGFHVSGCLAMLPELQADLKTALNMGVSLFAGELEGRMDTILEDAANGTLKPIYNYMKDLPAIQVAADPDSSRRPFATNHPVARELRRRSRLSRISARSAPSSTSRAGNRADVRRTTSSARSASTRPTASATSSSPTTIWPATRIGSPFSTGSSSYANATA